MTAATTGASVWIVLPTLNESENIVPMLDGIRQAMHGQSYSVCVVDDGSRDGTVERADAFARAHPEMRVELIRRRKTHGGSQRGIATWTGLRHGFVTTHSDVFVEMDADLSHRPEELAIGIELVRASACGVAIASKYLEGSRVENRPWGRRALSFVANAVVRRLITSRIRDYSNGYRFYDRHAVALISSHRLRYGSPIYLTEILALLLSHDVRVREFASVYVGRGEGLSKLRMLDLSKAGIAVFDIAARFHLRRAFPGRAVAPSMEGPVSVPERGLGAEAKADRL